LKRSYSIWNTVLPYLVGVSALLGLFLFGKKKNQDQESTETKVSGKFNLLSPPLYDRLLQWFIKEEGLKLKPYPDGVGFSIGIGHFIKPNEKYLMNGITRDQAIKLFNEDLQSVANTMNESIKVDLKPNEALAISSLIFNIGGGAFKDSTLLKLLNQNNKTQASLQFSVWNQSRDRFNILRPNPVLTARRQREALMFKVGF
jgi:lysozyme